MINTAKLRKKNKPEKFVAGVMPGDGNIEFVGIKETKEVIWMRYGSSHYFKDLPDDIYNELENKYLQDANAVQYISGIENNPVRQVELYTYYMYGEIDTTPDWTPEGLSENENFITNEDCPSIDFSSKHIRLNGHKLSKKEIKIIFMMKKEYTDQRIASELSIHIQTFYYHKKKLYEKAGVMTRAGLINTIKNNGL